MGIALRRGANCATTPTQRVAPSPLSHYHNCSAKKTTSVLPSLLVFVAQLYAHSSISTRFALSVQGVQPATSVKRAASRFLISNFTLPRNLLVIIIRFLSFTTESSRDWKARRKPKERERLCGEHCEKVFPLPTISYIAGSCKMTLEINETIIRFSL